MKPEPVIVIPTEDGAGAASKRRGRTRTHSHGSLDTNNNNALAAVDTGDYIYKPHEYKAKGDYKLSHNNHSGFTHSLDRINQQKRKEKDTFFTFDAFLKMRTDPDEDIITPREISLESRQEQFEKDKKRGSIVPMKRGSLLPTSRKGSLVPTSNIKRKESVPDTSLLPRGSFTTFGQILPEKSKHTYNQHEYQGHEYLKSREYMKAREYKSLHTWEKTKEYTPSQKKDSKKKRHDVDETQSSEKQNVEDIYGRLESNATVVKVEEKEEPKKSKWQVFKEKFRVGKKKEKALEEIMEQDESNDVANSSKESQNRKQSIVKSEPVPKNIKAEPLPSNIKAETVKSSDTSEESSDESETSSDEDIEIPERKPAAAPPPQVNRERKAPLTALELYFQQQEAKRAANASYLMKANAQNGKAETHSEVQNESAIVKSSVEREEPNEKKKSVVPNSRRQSVAVFLKKQATRRTSSVDQLNNSRDETIEKKDNEEHHQDFDNNRRRSSVAVFLKRQESRRSKEPNANEQGQENETKQEGTVESQAVKTYETDKLKAKQQDKEESTDSSSESSDENSSSESESDKSSSEDEEDNHRKAVAMGTGITGRDRQTSNIQDKTKHSQNEKNDYKNEQFATVSVNSNSYSNNTNADTSQSGAVMADSNTTAKEIKAVESDVKSVLPSESVPQKQQTVAKIISTPPLRSPSPPRRASTMEQHIPAPDQQGVVTPTPQTVIVLHQVKNAETKTALPICKEPSNVGQSSKLPKEESAIHKAQKTMKRETSNVGKLSKKEVSSVSHKPLQITKEASSISMHKTQSIKREPSNLGKTPLTVKREASNVPKVKREASNVLKVKREASNVMKVKREASNVMKVKREASNVIIVKREASNVNKHTKSRKKKSNKDKPTTENTPNETNTEIPQLERTLTMVSSKDTPDIESHPVLAGSVAPLTASSHPVDDLTTVVGSPLFKPVTLPSHTPEHDNEDRKGISHKPQTAPAPYDAAPLSDDMFQNGVSLSTGDIRDHKRGTPDSLATTTPSTPVAPQRSVRDLLDPRKTAPETAARQASRAADLDRRKASTAALPPGVKAKIAKHTATKTPASEVKKETVDTSDANKAKFEPAPKFTYYLDNLAIAKTKPTFAYNFAPPTVDEDYETAFGKQQSEAEEEPKSQLVMRQGKLEEEVEEKPVEDSEQTDTKPDKNAKLKDDKEHIPGDECGNVEKTDQTDTDGVSDTDVNVGDTGGNRADDDGDGTESEVQKVSKNEEEVPPVHKPAERASSGIGAGLLAAGLIGAGLVTTDMPVNELETKAKIHYRKEKSTDAPQREPDTKSTPDNKPVSQTTPSIAAGLLAAGMLGVAPIGATAETSAQQPDPEQPPQREKTPSYEQSQTTELLPDSNIQSAESHTVERQHSAVQLTRPASRGISAGLLAAGLLGAGATGTQAVQHQTDPAGKSQSATKSSHELPKPIEPVVVQRESDVSRPASRGIAAGLLAAGLLGAGVIGTKPETPENEPIKALEDSTRGNDNLAEPMVTQPALQLTSQPISQPTPQPVVQPAPQPVVQPAPQPVVQPAPQPVVHPAPQPVVQPAPQPVVQPAPQPVVQPAPQPVVQPAPQPVMQQDPKQVMQQDPKPVVQPPPQQVVQAAPQPVVQPAPGPVVQLTDQPFVQPPPQPEVQPPPQQVVQVAAQPVVQTAPEPVVQLALQPVVQPATQQVMQPPPQVVQPNPQPGMQPAPQAVVQLAHHQVVQAAPQPVVQPVPEPVVQPAHQPVVQPANQQVVQPAPQAVVQPPPQQVVQAAAQPVVQPVPGPVVQPAPQPVVQPAPQPVVEPAPQPVVEPAPQPVVQPAPQPVVQLAAQPIIQPAPQPVSQSTHLPVSQTTPQPPIQPPATAISEPTPQPTVQAIPLTTASHQHVCSCHHNPVNAPPIAPVTQVEEHKQQPPQLHNHQPPVHQQLPVYQQPPVHQQPPVPQQHTAHQPAYQQQPDYHQHQPGPHQPSVHQQPSYQPPHRHHWNNPENPQQPRLHQSDPNYHHPLSQSQHQPPQQYTPQLHYNPNYDQRASIPADQYHREPLPVNQYPRYPEDYHRENVPGNQHHYAYRNQNQPPNQDYGHPSQQHHRGSLLAADQQAQGIPRNNRISLPANLAYHDGHPETHKSPSLPANLAHHGVPDHYRRGSVYPGRPPVPNHQAFQGGPLEEEPSPDPAKFYIGEEDQPETSRMKRRNSKMPDNSPGRYSYNPIPSSSMSSHPPPAIKPPLSTARSNKRVSFVPAQPPIYDEEEDGGHIQPRSSNIRPPPPVSERQYEQNAARFMAALRTGEETPSQAPTRTHHRMRKPSMALDAKYDPSRGRAESQADSQVTSTRPSSEASYIELPAVTKPPPQYPDSARTIKTDQHPHQAEWGQNEGSPDDNSRSGNKYRDPLAKRPQSPPRLPPPPRRSPPPPPRRSPPPPAQEEPPAEEEGPTVFYKTPPQPRQPAAAAGNVPHDDSPAGRARRSIHRSMSIFRFINR